MIPDLVLSLGDSAKIGTLPKDKAQGKIVDEWNQAYVEASLTPQGTCSSSRIAGAKNGVESVDMNLAVSQFLLDKDGEEMVS